MARPIMVIILVMKVLSSRNCPTTAAMPMASTMETTDSRRGMPAATSAPNTSTRMTRATPTPNISPVFRSLSPIWVKSRLMLGPPVTSTSKPSPWPAFLTAADSTSTFFSTSVRLPAIDTGMTVA